MNELKLAWQFIVAPSTALQQLKERPRFLFPLIALIVASALLLTWYYSIVDFEWLKDRLFSGNESFARMNEEQRSRMLAMMTRRSIMVSGLAGALLALPVVLVVESTYYLVAGKVANARLSFKEWFSLVCWAGIPSLAGVIAGCLVLLMATNRQIDPSEIQVLSINNLFLRLSPGERGYQLASSFNLLSFWGWFIVALAVHKWCNKSWPFAVLYVALPFAVVYGGMAYFTLR